MQNISIVEKYCDVINEKICGNHKTHQAPISLFVPFPLLPSNIPLIFYPPSPTHAFHEFNVGKF